jgi:hypothetical protein
VVKEKWVELRFWLFLYNSWREFRCFLLALSTYLALLAARLVLPKPEVNAPRPCRLHIEVSKSGAAILLTSALNPAFSQGEGETVSAALKIPAAGFAGRSAAKPDALHRVPSPRGRRSG